MDLSVLNHALHLKTGASNAQNASGENDGSEKVINIELDKIKADPNQPRKSFDANDIQALADDIRSHGLIQPIIVRTDGIGQYIVVAGERRLRAFQLLKEPKIKAIVRNDYEQDKLGYIQMAENIKRADLKFYEMAEFIVGRIESGVKQTTLADELGLSKSTISQYMSWADAPEYIKDAKDRLGSVRAFYDLLSLVKENEDAVKEFLNEKAGERISVSAVFEFKKKLMEPEQEDSTYEDGGLDGLTANDEHGTEDSLDSEAESQEYEDQLSGSGLLSSDVESDSREDLEDSQSISESSESTESMDVSETELSGNDVTDAYEGSKSEDSVSASTDSNEAATYEDRESMEPDMEPDVDDKSSDEDKLKKPLIVGSVEGREGYLQFKRRPSTDGFLWIKWDDGLEEEVLAEEFRINRIIES